MPDLHGIPYFEVRFSKEGQRQDDVTLPAGTTDLVVISHGWRNDEDDARKLYREFFGTFSGLLGQANLGARRFAIVGVLWPSISFRETIAVKSDAGSGGSAALHGALDIPASDLEEAKARLQDLKDLFPEQAAVIAEAEALLPELERKETARRAFAQKIRGLLDPGAAHDEDASKAFFARDEAELLEDLRIEETDVEESAAPAGGAATRISAGQVETPEGGAVGLKSFFSRFAAAATNYTSYATYYAIKTRAGTVGGKGVGLLIDALAPQVERIHLIGHSFGGRLVTAAAAGSTTDKLHSVTLLQAAFSHHGFAGGQWNGFFRSVVEKKRVRGVIAITHTGNDKANRTSYPLASRINRDARMALGDAKDKFGAIGSNGAQQMGQGEVLTSEPVLRPAGERYGFTKGTIANLRADAFIKNHGDVTNAACAWAALSAMQ